MDLAHGGAAGPNVEALVLAVPMVVVGIVLFVQKSAKPVVSVMLVLGGIGIAWGGFTFLDEGDDHEDASASAEPDARYSDAVQGLCVARDRLAADDLPGASTSFFDDSHAALHDLADRLSDEDRAAAAELLRSKEAVESGLEGNEELDQLQRDLDGLIIATIGGLAEIDVEVSGCR